MPSIFFNVRPGLEHEHREVVLDRLGGLPAVQRVAALDPESPSEAVRRMCYAQVADDADVHGLLREIREMPEVESADLPAQRGIV